MKPIHAERMTHEERDRLDREARAVEAIDQGLADAEAGRVVDDTELDEVLRARLGDLID
jgi:predicted transcriptional regulator